MSTQCPSCEAIIPSADINVSTDIALCRKCDENFQYSTLVDQSELYDVDLSVLSKYLTMQHGTDVDTLIYKKIPKVMLFLIPFTLLWSGVSMAGMVTSIVESGLSEETIFFLPFLFGTIILVSIILFCVFGKRTVTCDRHSLKIFIGVGPIGNTKQFDISDFKKVSLAIGSASSNNRPLKDIQIELEDKSKPLKFGAFMDEACKLYFAAYIRNVCGKHMQGRSRKY